MTLLQEMLTVLRAFLTALWETVSKLMLDLLSRILDPKTSPDSSNDPASEE